MTTSRVELGEVVVVGAGIVGLTTALTLLRSGQRVRVLDRGKDPRKTLTDHGLGASWAGLGARMYTRTEADVYDEFFGLDGDVDQSTIPWGPGGLDLRARSPRSLTGRPPAVDRPSAGDRAAAVYATTLRAGRLWDELLASLPSGHEHRRHDIVFRGYSTRAAHLHAVERHRRLGDLIRVVAADEVGDEVPALRERHPRTVAGGIWVDGFTVDVHRVMLSMITAIVAAGGQLHFETVVERVLSPDGNHQQHTVCTHDGGRLPARHVVLAVGASGNPLAHASGFRSAVTGMVGAWIALPDVYGVRHSMKVRRPGAACEDANITVGVHEGRPALLVGSGYGHTGEDPDDVAPDALRAMTEDIVALCRALFPRASLRANLAEQIAEPRFCVRPWTADSVPLHDVRRTGSGSVHLVTGHNTGGFAMAPAVAVDVATSLETSTRPLHEMIG